MIGSEQAVLLLHLSHNLDRQAEAIDESGRVALVVDVILTEGRELLLVERERRGGTGRHDRALVELQARRARHVLVVGVQRALDALARELEAGQVHDAGHGVLAQRRGHGVFAVLPLTVGERDQQDAVGRGHADGHDRAHHHR